MYQRKKIIIGLVIGVAVAFIFLYNFRSKKQVFDYTEPIQRGTILESVYGIGTVTARKSYQVKSGVTNYIRKLYVREGDKVQKGDRIIDLEGATFNAPFDGTVTWVPVKVGELAFAQAVMVSLVDLTDRYLIVSLDQRGALRVKNGQKAKISFDSFRDETYDGLVESIYSNENNFLVRIDVSKFPAQILPGMTADVAIGIAEHKNVLVVPTTALSDGKVLVKGSNGKPKPVEVQIGIVDGVMAEVTSEDLHEGDRLAIQKKAK